MLMLNMVPNDDEPSQREEETKRTKELRRLLEDYAADLRALMEKFRCSSIEPADLDTRLRPPQFERCISLLA